MNKQITFEDLSDLANYIDCYQYMFNTSTFYNSFEGIARIVLEEYKNENGSWAKMLKKDFDEHEAYLRSKNFAPRKYKFPPHPFTFGE